MLWPCLPGLSGWLSKGVSHLPTVSSVWWERLIIATGEGVPQSSTASQEPGWLHPYAYMLAASCAMTISFKEEALVESSVAMQYRVVLCLFLGSGRGHGHIVSS